MIWLLDISVQSCFIGKFAKDAWVLCTFSYAPIPSESPRSNRPVKSRALPGTWQGYFRKSTTLSLCELEMLRWGTWHRMGSTWFNYKGLCQSYAGEHIYIYIIIIYIYIYIYIYISIYIYLQSLRSGQSGHLEGTSPVSLGGWIRCHGRKGSPGIHTRVGPNLCCP